MDQSSGPILPQAVTTIDRSKTWLLHMRYSNPPFRSAPTGLPRWTSVYIIWIRTKAFTRSLDQCWLPASE